MFAASGCQRCLQQLKHRTALMWGAREKRGWVTVSNTFLYWGSTFLSRLELIERTINWNFLKLIISLVSHRGSSAEAFRFALGEDADCVGQAADFGLRTGWFTRRGVRRPCFDTTQSCLIETTTADPGFLSWPLLIHSQMRLLRSCATANHVDS